MCIRPSQVLLNLTLLTLALTSAAHSQQGTSATPVRGDVNGDGRVTAADAQAVREHVAGRPTPPGWVLLPNGDANGDGRITGVDAAMIQAHAAGRDLTRFRLGQAIGSMVTRYECTVDTELGTHQCSTIAPDGAARLDIILGKPHVVFITTGAASSRGDATNEDSTTAYVALANQMGQPIGTTDGASESSSGNRIFFHQSPRVTSVKVGTITTESARVDNPDGIGSFTSPDGTYTRTEAPFFQYDGVLATGASSAPKLWRFVYSANTKTFSYSVSVSAPVQFEYGWITLAPASPVVGVGESGSPLAATSHDVAGATVQEAVRWSSSNTAVAVVDSTTGVVTGLAEGTATITATSSVQPRRKGTAVLVIEARVPAQSPDSVPESVYAAQNIATDLDGMSGTYLRDIVSILFAPGAPVEQRQAAVDLIQGKVVGGLRAFGDDGFYFVRIPGDGTANPMLSAISTLNELPQVVGAAPEFIQNAEDAVAYARPDDGPGWAAQDWNLDIARAATVRWGLEVIGAPQAWGCETGSADTEVAVVDHGFALNQADDIRLNTQGRHYFAAGPIYDGNIPVNHGNQVASVIGARGSNQQGMTGVSWNVKLSLYEGGTTNEGKPTYSASGKPNLRHSKARIAEAIWSGARVVNVSIAMTPPPPMAARIRSGTATRADSTAARQYANGIRWAIRWNRLIGRRPLIVFAAGNQARPGVDAHGNPQPGVLDAFWSGYPILAGEFPDQVIVAGAAMQAGSASGGFLGGPFHRSAFSQGGPLVSIAAPGSAVGTMGVAGTVVPQFGTSFAAPLVTGAAALLFSFDPSLTTSEVVNLLVEGARRGNRYIEDPLVTSVPVLNVHESLKLAAQRPGAPLCGNRVWLENGVVRARRSPVGGEQLENLFSVGPNFDYLQVLHGGKRIYFYDGDQSANDGYRFFRWSPAYRTWGEESVPEDSTDARLEEYGPSFRSLAALSHDGDSVAVVVSAGSAGDVRIQPRSGGGGRSIGSVQLPSSNSRGAYECVVRRTWTHHSPSRPVESLSMCIDSIQPGTTSTAKALTVAFAPRGDKVLLAVTTNGSGTSVGAPRECHAYRLNYTEDDYTDFTFECRDYSETAQISDGRIYSFRADTVGPAATLASEAANFHDIAVSDDGEEFVVKRNARSIGDQISWKVQYDPAPPGSSTAGSRGYPVRVISRSGGSSCSTEFRRVSDGTMLSGGFPCSPYYSDFTFAPNRVPARPTN